MNYTIMLYDKANSLLRMRLKDNLLKSGFSVPLAFCSRQKPKVASFLLDYFHNFQKQIFLNQLEHFPLLLFWSWLIHKIFCRSMKKPVAPNLWQYCTRSINAMRKHFVLKGVFLHAEQASTCGFILHRRLWAHVQ